ncbi:MAG: hypothetical protein OEY32_14880 [Candidatus Krumholzibacteria bacterium]|nr:hypothetical protein [Candidatus Krumholzibacteria bacterium]MDH5271199.1 hypothetical protein [Candidatus Krumholzibacteria bacterium]
MKQVIALSGLLSAVFLLVSVAPNPEVAIAHPPKSSCFATFLTCRIYCVNTFAPNEGEPIVWNQQANACLLDCDVDVTRCVFEEIGGAFSQVRHGVTGD